MPSMEGEEGCYLKNSFLAHAAPLEVHGKQKDSSIVQNSAFDYPQRNDNTLLCSRCSVQAS